ncbi:MAG: type I polyketide synthase [Planctomycetota bacterium]|nr:type I polyketide synthase [Planctomycetota bacterium]
MKADGNEIAIIGLAGRFPGAACVEEFWRNLRDGVESITTFSPEEVEPSVLNPLEVSDAAYVRAGAVLPGADLFDAPFFGMSARDAEITDPQHRLMLECAWEALESAGYDSARYAGRVGVFCACGSNGYLTNNLLRNPDVLYDVDRYQATIGNDKDYVATRVAYAMNLRGPSLSVQTACSSSLVAVHLARQSLLAGECDMALAGGVALRVPLREGHLYKPGSFVSRDGHTRAFDADADGTMFTSAVGVVVLKRLGAARADADRIRAVVKGSAVNNDGSDKGSYTAPSRSGQVAVYRQAMAAAGVTPETITCVEAHGTATPTGDPIEVAALTEAFADGSPRAAPCALGTAKTNIGHANTASGMVGLIKMVLSLEHGQLPASLHYRRANPAIDFAASPFYVNAALQAWSPAPGAPRRAMVNSLGVGGTNACVVLDEAPPADARPAATEPEHLLTVSARSARAMEAACRRLGEYLRQNPQTDLGDVCYTLHVGRRAFRHRRAIVCRSAAQAIEALSGSAPGAVFTGAAPAWRRHVVFLFSGMASEHVHMAADLYRGEAEFRRAFDQCADLLQEPLGLDLRQIVYPAPGGLDAAARVLSSPAVAPAAVFTASYAPPPRRFSPVRRWLRRRSSPPATPWLGCG